MERKEIVGSRVKTVLFFAFSLTATIVAVTLWRTDDDKALLWTAIFFGICALTFAWLLIRPQRLLLYPEGFGLAGGLVRRPKLVGWGDVTHFFVVPIHHRTSMIGFNYRTDCPNRPRGVTVANRLSGADGALHGVWPSSNAAIVDELNAYRDSVMPIPPL